MHVTLFCNVYFLFFFITFYVLKVLKFLFQRF